MTRKHYEVFAKVLNEEYQSINDHKDRRTVVRITERLADYFGEDNMRFDRERFFAAAGVTDQV